jgi:predicted anti-sigma-YlaC factor YlaD
MRLVGQLSNGCEYAREHVSLQLDGELSEFEQIALDAHLKTCSRCRAYAASVGAVSVQLRAAALEQPEFPVVLPHRSRLRVPARAVVQVAAAAAVAVVVGLSSAGLSLTNGGQQSVSLRASKAFPDRGPNLEPVRTSRTTIEFRSQRRTAPRPMSGRVAV